MATGITKNKWQENTQIISDEIFHESVVYSLEYKGKTPSKTIINEIPTQEYQRIFGNDSNN